MTFFDLPYSVVQVVVKEASVSRVGILSQDLLFLTIYCVAPDSHIKINQLLRVDIEIMIDSMKRSIIFSEELHFFSAHFHSFNFDAELK